jgi:integrase
VRAAKPLGPVTTRSKHPPADINQQAEELAAAINGSNVRPEMVRTIDDFVDTVYLPMAEKEKRPSTYADYSDIWNIHLKPRCVQFWLKDVETYHLQRWLDDISKCNPQLSRNRLRHIKSLLSGIFSQAIRLGYRANRANPARDTRITAGVASQETHAYTLDEIQSMLGVLPEPAATMIAVAAFTGLRRGEITGLLWENFQAGEIRVTRSIWEGIATDPKTRTSRGAVPVIRPLQQRLEMHRLRVATRNQARCFRGTPISPNNVLTRSIKSVLSRCGVCQQAKEGHNPNDGHEYTRDAPLPQWHGWQVFRRGLASNLYALGVPDVVIQNILRHANLSTTMTYYVITTPEATHAAMAKLESVVPATIQ